MRGTSAHARLRSECCADEYQRWLVADHTLFGPLVCFSCVTTLSTVSKVAAACLRHLGMSASHLAVASQVTTHVATAMLGHRQRYR